MRRREFMVSTLAAAALLRAVGARSAARLAGIGWLSRQQEPATTLFLEAFRAGLADLGYVEGRNMAIAARYADDVPDRLPALAEELVRLPVDVIVVLGPATVTVGRLGLTVPVVYAYSGDPIEAGLAESLARPRGNMTGQTFMSVELNGKRLELLREILPGIRRVAIVTNPTHPGEHLELADSEQMARRLGMTIQYLPARTSAELDGVFAAMAVDMPEAIVVFPDALVVQHRQRIVDFAMSRRVPVVSGWAIIAQSGALVTYGPRLTESYRRLAYYVDRILKGAKPSELPIERPTVLELVVNLKTAKALGLAIPPAILLRADEVIE